MDANPNAVQFVDQDIDVVVPSTDGSKLIPCQSLQGTHRIELPGLVIKQLVIYPHRILQANAKREPRKYIIHDLADIAADIVGLGIKANGLVATANVVADTGWADFVRVGHHATDGHSIALVVVSHQCHAIRGFRTASDLR